MSENFVKLQSSIVKLVCVLIIAIAVETYGDKFKGLYETFGRVFYMLGGTFLTANLMSKPIQDFQKALSPYLPRIFSSDQKLDDCMYRYNRLKPYITRPDTIKKLETYIKDAEIMLCNGIDYNTQYDAIIQKINYILTLHEPVPKIKINIKDVISQFDDMIIDNKEELIAKILVPFILKINGESNIPLNLAYLLGSAGVGKTFFVKRMSEILNIPIISATIINYNYQAQAHQYHAFDEKMIHMYIKSLHTAIVTKKTRTFIVFIDEFDKKIERTSNVLEYMNCNNNEVHDDYIDITTDIGYILPVCAGNKRISKIHKNYIPLDDRFVTINFPNLTKEIKSGIIYDTMDIPHSPGIDKIIENDKYHGIRQLLMKINIYRASVMGREYFKGTSWEKIIKKQLENASEKGDAEESSEELAEPTPYLDYPIVAGSSSIFSSSSSSSSKSRRARSKTPVRARR